MKINQMRLAANSTASTATCREELQPDNVSDTIDVPTQLGDTLIGNPYSVATMQQAAINLYGSAQGIVTNKKYIRYKPATLDQVDLLANSDIALFDYPLNTDVVQEGDYYPQAGLGESDIPWFYSVVDVNYQPIAGIQYESLADLYVPDVDTSLENEAFRITNNPIAPDCSSGSSLLSETSNVDIVPMVPQCPEGTHWDYTERACVDNGCPDGYIWDGTTCVPNTPQPPPVDIKKPAGQILVRDVINGTYRDVALRQVRVVARRWFKIELMYTDDNGRFQSSKRFQNKVNVFVKFKNNQVTTRGLRGIRLWQTLFPIKHGLGKYSGNLSNITWTYSSVGYGNERSNRNWWAAQLMNAYLEFNENALALNVGSAPSGMQILLTAWQDAAGSGSTPMNRHRNSFTFSDAFLRQFLVQPLTAYWGQVYNNVFNNNGIIRKMDMTLGYNTPQSYGAWTSDRVKELMYHELSHSAHFNKVGESWWNDFVYAEAYETSRFGPGAANSPYGIGDDGFLSDYISLAESWAEHLGQTIADRFYGLNSTSFFRQRSITYTNNQYINGSSHVNYLEDFSPFRTIDPFRWIPDGLYYDMIDNRNDAFASPLRVNINDAVSGYTNQQFFNALESDVKSIPAFRQRLLQQNNNLQATEVTQLFQAYGY